MRSLPALALLACTALAGCGGTMNRGMGSVHQPIVSRTDYVFDIAASGSRFAPSEEQRLRDWFDSLELRYGDRVSVDTRGYSDGAQDAVAAVVAPYGLLLDATAPVTAGTVPQGAVRVVVSRMSAAVPGCPDFSRASNAHLEGDSMSNYGCAVNANFAAMVADPRDLIAGRDAGVGVGVGTNGATSAKAIKSYRAAPTTGAGNAVKTEKTGGK